MKFGIRPLRMLATPICFAVALYASFVYGLLYGNLAAFPIIYEQGRGWNQLIGSLPFLALFVGVFIASAVNIGNQRYYIAAYKKAGNKPVPEARLPPMMIGSVLFTAGCFLLGWTADKRYSAAGPLIGTMMVGVGFFTIFQAALNYLIDTFTVYAASAIAANTFLRSIMGATFPLFINPMYARLGVAWGTSVFAFFAAALIPIPFLFFKYGPAIRARGKYSRESL
jgi:MFS family permease